MAGDQYRLTDDGELQLQRLYQAGKFRVDCLTIARWRMAVDDYGSGSQELQNLLEDSNRSFGCSIEMPIGALEAMITGTYSAEEAYALRYKTALAASWAASFPAGMNPEILIAEDDPLRQKRKAREDETVGWQDTHLALPVRQRADDDSPWR